MSEKTDIRQLVDDGGDLADRLVPIVYDELRARARAYLRGERSDHSLQPTALVNEAYLRLVSGAPVDWNGRTHFFAAAAVAMRRVLVDHARRRNSAKRGGGLRRVELDEPIAASGEPDVDLLALTRALDRLEALHARHARIVELRFFGGLTVPEVAAALGLSTTTVEEGWAFARAWLARELDGGS